MLGGACARCAAQAHALLAAHFLRALNAAESDRLTFACEDAHALRDVAYHLCHVRAKAAHAEP